MTQATPVHNFAFPQELVDLIVDHVAYASCDYNSYPEQPDLAGLITCTLISQCFSPRARAHLQRHISLRVHIDNVDERAHGLLQTLSKPRTECLSIPVMQSLSLVINDRKVGAINRTLAISPGRLQRESLGGLSKLIQHSHSTFHHFALVSRCSHQGDAVNTSTPTVAGSSSCLNQALLGVFTNFNLKTLHLVNIANVSLTRIADVFFLPHLVELTLNGLTFASETGEGSNITSTVATHIADSRELGPSLRTLEMRQIPYDALLRSVQSLISTSNQPSSQLPARLLFPKLQTLTASLNFDDDGNPTLHALTQIGVFMENNSSTLTTLEIENYGYPNFGKHFGSSMRSRIPLIKLSALQVLRFTICNESSLDFLKKILGDLVVGCKCRSPYHGSFKDLELKVVLPTKQSTTTYGTTVCQGITEACQLKIDPVLSSPQAVAFSGLENIKIFVIIFHCTASTSNTHVEDTLIAKFLPEIEKLWRSAFPKTTAIDSVKLSVKLRHVFSEDTMERYLRYSCCTKDSF